MSAALSVVSQKTRDLEEAERDLARAKGQLLALIGIGQVVAITNDDFRREVRKLVETGEFTAERFEQLEQLLQEELEHLSAAGEQFLDEDVRAVLP